MSEIDVEVFMAKICSRFSDFVRGIWDDRGFHKVAPLSDLEIEMCDWASGEHPDLPPGSNRRGVLALRGVGKTHLIAAALPLYRLLRDPNRQILEVSKSEPAAVKTTHMMRSWMDNVWFLQHLAPRRGQRDAKKCFDCGQIAGDNRQPSVSCYGLSGQLENNRAHSLFFDDIETKGNTKTLDGREQLATVISEGKNIIYPDNEWSKMQMVDPPEILVVGTVKHEDTVYAKLASRGYAFMTFPIVYPDPSWKIINLSPTIKRRMDTGQGAVMAPTFPHRFPQKEVNERLAEGMSEFLMESCCVVNLNVAHRHPLRIADLIGFPVNPAKHPASISWGTKDHNGQSTAIDIQMLGNAADRLHAPIMFEPVWHDYLRTIAFLDTAGKGEDELGMTIASAGGGYYWVHTVQGLRDGISTATLDYIIGQCQFYNVRELFFESNADVFGAFGQSLTQAVDRGMAESHIKAAGKRDPWTCNVIPHRSHGQKEERIIGTLEPVMNTHRLVIHPDALKPSPDLPREFELQHQLSRITKAPRSLKHDDRLDSFASAIGVLVTHNHLAPRSPLQSQQERIIAEAARMERENNEDREPVAEPNWRSTARVQ